MGGLIMELQDIITMHKNLCEHKMITQWQLPWKLEKPIVITGATDKSGEMHFMEHLIEVDWCEAQQYITFVTAENHTYLIDDINLEDVMYIMDQYHDYHD